MYNYTRFTRIIVGLSLVALAPNAAWSQEGLADRLTVHGSLNAAYGKSDGLPVFGINKDGTSNYRAVALQFGYKIGDRSRVVTQLLSREFGTSPLQSAEKDMFPVWAFYEHRLGNDVTVKVGRDPLPRGLFNEVRFIGTLLPFYRVAPAVYGETLEYIDGVVVNKPFDLGGGFKVDAHAFAGGTDVKAMVPGANGQNQVFRTRFENLVGTQLWLRTPLNGVRVGSFVTHYTSTPRASLPEASRPGASFATMYSAEGAWTKGFVRGEYQSFSSSRPQKTSYTAYYAQAGISPTEQFTLATEYSSTTNRMNLPAPYSTFDLNLGTDLAIGATWRHSAQLAVKLEGHRAEGYSFDTPVPTLVLPTTPPFRAVGAPRSKAFYGLASVAVTF